MSDLELRRVSGADVIPFLDDVARLRMTVFRAFPYLYDGDPDYEAAYLRTYSRAPGSVFVLALDDGRVVGASTGVPLVHEEASFRAPFEAHGPDPERVFYFGESVLESAYRGRGVGRRFFEERTAHARSLGGFDVAAFCAVERPDDHPRRPEGYEPLHAFWRRLGFERRPELQTTYRWKDLDEAGPSSKPMVFWTRPLDAPITP